MKRMKNLFAAPRLSAALALAGALLLSIAACGETESADASPSPATVQPPEFYGAASASVEERIYFSDAVVRASLSSTGTSSLSFKVIEYLKGTGPSDITVSAHPSRRNSSHDKREAVLFLSRGTSGASGASSGEFAFTDAHHIAPGYTVDTLDPAWLPAEAQQGGSGAAGSASAAAFITDSGAAPGMSKETISLADLRTKIAWVGGGQNITGYDYCVGQVLNYLAFYRDFEAYYGKTWPISQRNVPIVSGAGAGTAVHDYGSFYEPGYGRFWLTGRDKDLFAAPIVDSNTNAADGYTPFIKTARPLPTGVYNFRYHGTLYDFLPCNFTPKDGIGKHNWTITVTAPANTMHEAFFDPVAGVSIGGGSPVLASPKPRAFTGAGGVSANLAQIAYTPPSTGPGKGQTAHTVTMTLNPVTALAGQMVDFIKLDGTVGLSLNVASRDGERDEQHAALDRVLRPVEERGQAHGAHPPGPRRRADAHPRAQADAGAHHAAKARALTRRPARYGAGRKPSARKGACASSVRRNARNADAPAGLSAPASAAAG